MASKNKDNPYDFGVSYTVLKKGQNPYRYDESPIKFTYSNASKKVYGGTDYMNNTVRENDYAPVVNAVCKTDEFQQVNYFCTNKNG